MLMPIECTEVMLVFRQHQLLTFYASASSFLKVSFET